MIYLLNSREELVEIINQADIYVSEEKVRLTDENYASYILTAELRYLPRHVTEQVRYVMVANEDHYQSYFVSQLNVDNNRTMITGVSSIIEELQKSVVTELAGKTTLRNALLIALKDTDVELVIDTDIAQKPVEAELYFVKAWEAVKELSYYYGFEMDFRVNYDNVEYEQQDSYTKQLVAKRVLGDEKPEEAVIYGYNATSFSSDLDRTESVTALYGFGKVITETKAFKDYEKRVEERLKKDHGRHWQNFKPEYWFDINNPPKLTFSTVSSSDKPLGAKFIGVPQDSWEMETFGTYDRRTGQYRHKVDVVNFNDLEDPQAILDATRAELQRRLAEVTSYRVSAEDLDINIGDVIHVGTTDVLASSPTDKARVIEYIRDNMKGRNKGIQIGKHLTVSRNRKRREADTSPLANTPILSDFEGMDDFLSGNYDDLGRYGDWGYDDFGDSGLDFSTNDMGLNKPHKPSAPEVPIDKPDPWTPDNSDYPGVLAENVAVAPNTMTNTAIQNIGAQAVNYNNDIEHWNSYMSHSGTLHAITGMELTRHRLPNYSGLAKEEKNYYRVDGTIATAVEILYIIGDPHERIGDIASAEEIDELGYSSEGINFDQTIAEVYGGSYELPPNEPITQPWVANGLNILADHFVILPNDLDSTAMGTIVARSVDNTSYFEEAHLTTIIYNGDDTKSLQGASGLAGVRIETHHRDHGVIDSGAVLVIVGGRDQKLGEIIGSVEPDHIHSINANYSSAYNRYYDHMLSDPNSTIGEIYDQLATTYESEEE